jgi:glycosidase
MRKAALLLWFATLSCDVAEQAYVPPPLASAAAAGAGNEACAVAFRYAPPLGQRPAQVAIVGEWDHFASPVPLTKTERGFETSLHVPASDYAYRLSVDGALVRDTGNALRAYANGIEMSLLRVAPCGVPALSLLDHNVARASSSTFTARIRISGAEASTAVLRSDGATRPLALESTSAADVFSIPASNLTDGKYTAVVSARNAAGDAAPLRLVFWAEAEPFSWNGSTMYMVMTDRFRDAVPASNAKPIPGVDPRAQFLGGDLDGVRLAIADGSFDKLAVKVLWLSPFHTNSGYDFASDDGAAQVAGYHGYWPVKPREVDPRIGGNEALTALVQEAHRHGIRVMQDFVINHVHEGHDYVREHPEWFRKGCVCGTANCGWTTKRLECLFSPFLPDVDWTNRLAAEQFASDAVWWVDTFHLDGLRMDAVKHVEDVAVFNLVDRLRGTFEKTGTRFFMTGETAMGWNGETLVSNASEYGTINRYLGTGGLDGQFDFVLHHAASYRVFAHHDRGLAHAAYWTQASLWQYAPGSIMTPYLGSHDTPRFITWATYRGADRSTANNKWRSAATVPPDAEAFTRHRLALAWLLTLPGAPLIYYGDEYGAWGGADPNNRTMMKREDALNDEERETLAWARAVGTLRSRLPALRFGDYEPLWASDDALVALRQAPSGESAIVALSRAAAPTTVSIALPPIAGIKDGTKLRDHLGGSATTVAQGVLTITLAARSAAVYAE